MSTLTEWQQKNPLFFKADAAAKLVYKVSCRFPDEERFGMTSQIRRAGISIILNIVEGFARGTHPEYKRFLLIAFGSAKETTYLAAFANEQGYISESEFEELYILLEEVNKLLWSTIKKLD